MSAMQIYRKNREVRTEAEGIVQGEGGELRFTIVAKTDEDKGIAEITINYNNLDLIDDIGVLSNSVLKELADEGLFN